MQQSELVSVIVPVYNSEKYIAAAINSILAQQYHPLEIIVIDDGSTDDTARIVQGFGESISYYFQENAGPAVARNVGLKNANGQFITFLDADDTWESNKLAIQLHCLQENPKIDVTFGKKKVFETQQKDYGDESIIIHNDSQVTVNLAAGLFRKEVFEQVGHFDESLRYSEDWDWHLRAKEMGVAIMTHDDLVYSHRCHDNNMTNDPVQGNYYCLRMLKKSLDRRRDASDGKVRDLPKISEFKKYRKSEGADPLISVIMTLYNAQQYVCETMDSVLGQDFESFEFIIIVDDGSTDNTGAVVKEYIDTYDHSDRIRFYAQENQGISGARNKGLSFARGKYFAFTDGDDICAPGKLSKQMDFMLKRPDLDMVFGYVKQFCSPELSLEERSKIHCPDSKEVALIAAAMLIKASSFRRVGNFDPQWRVGDFVDWFTRAKEYDLKYEVLPDIVFRRRLHKNNMGIYLHDARVDYVRILKQSLDRRRAKEEIT